MSAATDEGATPTGLRVLVLWPPHVPSYFNAGHRLVTYQVAGHLRRRPDVREVLALDASALAMTWKELADVLFGGWDVVAVANDHDAVDGLERTLKYARALSPRAKLVTFGRLGHESGAFFRQFDLDGIVEHGDNEVGVAAFLDWLHAPTSAPLAGVAVRCEGTWIAPDRPGGWLDPSEWSLPDPAEIPHAAHDFLYRREANKFCGIPGRRELVVPVARGCPVRCSFCDVPAREGIRERRLSVDAVMAYVEAAFDDSELEYVSMYAPTFTLDRAWVLELCARWQAAPREYPWKCTTTPRHLDEALVTAMGAAGCRRISVGLETLDPAALRGLPRLKQVGARSIDDVARWCTAAGIELNCFVIVGLPGSSPEGDDATIRHVEALGARVRPMMYTPFEAISEHTRVADMSSYNRQLGDPAVPAALAQRRYALLFGPDRTPTTIAHSIPKRAP